MRIPSIALTRSLVIQQGRGSQAPRRAQEGGAQARAACAQAGPQARAQARDPEARSRCVAPVRASHRVDAAAPAHEHDDHEEADEGVVPADHDAPQSMGSGKEVRRPLVPRAALSHSISPRRTTWLRPPPRRPPLWRRRGTETTSRRCAGNTQRADSLALDRSLHRRDQCQLEAGDAVRTAR